MIEAGSEGILTRPLSSNHGDGRATFPLSALRISRVANLDIGHSFNPEEIVDRFTLGILPCLLKFQPVQFLFSREIRMARVCLEVANDARFDPGISELMHRKLPKISGAHSRQFCKGSEVLGQASGRRLGLSCEDQGRLDNPQENPCPQDGLHRTSKPARFREREQS